MNKPTIDVNHDHVICPNCNNQFRAIPVNVQTELFGLRERLKYIDAALAEPEQVKADAMDAGRLDFLESMAQQGKVEIAKSLFGTGYEVGHWKHSVSVQVTNGTLREAIDRARSANAEK